MMQKNFGVYMSNLEYKWNTIADKIIAEDILDSNELASFKADIYCDPTIYKKILEKNKTIANEALEIIFGHIEESGDVALLEPYGKLIVDSGVDVARLNFVTMELFDIAIMEQNKEKIASLLKFIENDLQDEILLADSKEEAWMFGLID
jgi:hypothetical protein